MSNLSGEIMKLEDFFGIVYDYEDLSIFTAGSSDYVLHRVLKGEVIKRHPELLDREIHRVGVHWYEYEDECWSGSMATLEIVLV